MFPVKNAPANHSCDCEVDHLAWGAVRTITMTIYLGGGQIDPGALDLPPIEGRTSSSHR